jgi:hypothetical protein
MSSLLKNIFIAAICIVLVVLGYYLIVDTSNQIDTSDQGVQAELISKTGAFIERSQRLKQVVIEPSFFTDSVFTSLRSYSTDVPDQPIGRTDLFGESKNIIPKALDDDEDADVTE